MAKGKYHEWLTPESLTLLEGWTRDGLTDEQVAKKIGISLSTFYSWKNEHPEFSEALKKGKEVIDTIVENALLKRALGYKVVEITEETGDFGSKIKKVTKEVPPDVTAQIFWLKNRRPDKWRDKPVSESDAGGGIVADILKAVHGIE